MRRAVIGHLRNIDEELTASVAAGWVCQSFPAGHSRARPTRQDLPASPALSILLNGPESFAGRVMGG